MLGLALLTALSLHLQLFSYSPLVSSIIVDMRLSYAEAGFIFSVCMLTLILLRIPWGLCCDRFGFRLVIGVATLLMGLFGLLRGFATDYAMLLALQVLLGVGMAAVIPGLPRLVGASFAKKKIGVATGVYVAGFAIGDMLGIGLTPYILNLLGTWRSVFVVYGVWGLILALAWWALTKEQKLAGWRPVGHDSRKSLRSSLLTVIKIKEVWILTALFITAGGCYDTVLMWLPYQLQARGAQPDTVGLIASMLPLGFLISSPSVGALSDHGGSRKRFIQILGLITGPAIYLACTASGATLLAAAFITGFSTIGIVTLVLTMPIESKETAPHVASAVGIISSVGNVGSLVMPVLVGLTRDLTGSFLPAAIMLAIVGEASFMLGLLTRETSKERTIASHKHSAQVSTG